MVVINTPSPLHGNGLVYTRAVHKAGRFGWRVDTVRCPVEVLDDYVLVVINVGVDLRLCNTLVHTLHPLLYPPAKGVVPEGYGPGFVLLALSNSLYSSKDLRKHITCKIPYICSNNSKNKG